MYITKYEKNAPLQGIDFRHCCSAPYKLIYIYYYIILYFHE